MCSSASSISGPTAGSTSSSRGIGPLHARSKSSQLEPSPAVTPPPKNQAAAKGCQNTAYDCRDVMDLVDVHVRRLDRRSPKPARATNCNAPPKPLRESQAPSKRGSAQRSRHAVTKKSSCREMVPKHRLRRGAKPAYIRCGFRRMRPRPAPRRRESNGGPSGHSAGSGYGAASLLQEDFQEVQQPANDYAVLCQRREKAAAADMPGTWLTE
jgi:hypothetical protein